MTDPMQFPNTDGEEPEPQPPPSSDDMTTRHDPNLAPTPRRNPCQICGFPKCSNCKNGLVDAPGREEPLTCHFIRLMGQKSRTEDFWPLPELFKGAHVSDFHTLADAERRRKAMSAIVWGNNPVGGLIIHGKYGTGKTHLAVAIYQQQWEDSRRALFVSCSTIIRGIKATFEVEGATAEQYMKPLATAEFLAIDDVGKQSETKWADEQIFDLINDRYGAMLPTLITTNKTPEELVDQSEHWAAIIDRLKQGGKCINLGGESMRKPGPEQETTGEG